MLLNTILCLTSLVALAGAVVLVIQGPRSNHAHRFREQLLPLLCARHGRAEGNRHVGGPFATLSGSLGIRARANSGLGYGLYQGYQRQC